MPEVPARRSALDPVMIAKLLFLAIAAWWSASAMHAGSPGLVEGIIIYTHEAGHWIFSFFGRFVTVAGGTINQLLFPLIFIVRFFWRGERYSAGITCFWLALSFADSSQYCQDAIDQSLPLIHTGLSASEELAQYGETEHDWVNMLDMLHLPLSAAHPIAQFLFLLGMVAWLVGVGTAAVASGIPLPASPAALLATWRRPRRPARRRPAGKPARKKP
ncbi:MAG TPA: hypothetical protein V6D47_01195 [Oscillatoriaceae cyanobacterium]